MRILQIDKFFYNRGGSSRVFFDTINGLRERGHEVSEFSAQDPKNLPSEYSSYFINPLPDLKRPMALPEKWRVFKHLFRSKEVKHKLGTLVLATEPEVAHIHNAYHQLSAEIFLTLKQYGIPAVMTVHDVFPLCPNHSLLYKESLREDLFKNKPYNCAFYKCIDNKFLPSLAGTMEAYYYRYKKIWDNIGFFICPSQFMADKMAEYGFPKEKMRIIRNPYLAGADDILPLGKKIVYLGRVHFEKGIKFFMEALKQLPEYSAIVAGNGPEDKWVNDYIKREKISNVERLEWVSGENWKRVMSEARVVVVPSIFLENCSLTILEALSRGRLVVASDRGGNPELIINGRTGFLAKPENAADLAAVIRQAMGLPPDEAEKIIRQGRDLVEKNHHPEKYFEKLIEVYNEATKSEQGSPSTKIKIHSR